MQCVNCVSFFFPLGIGIINLNLPSLTVPLMALSIDVDTKDVIAQLNGALTDGTQFPSCVASKGSSLKNILKYFRFPPLLYSCFPMLRRRSTYSWLDLNRETASTTSTRGRHLPSAVAGHELTLVCKHWTLKLTINT